MAALSAIATVTIQRHKSALSLLVGSQHDPTHIAAEIWCLQQFTDISSLQGAQRQTHWLLLLL